MKATCTIAINAAVSNSFGCDGRALAFGVICPDDWTDADLGFEVSYDNGTTWHLLKTETGTIKFTSLPTTGGFARVLTQSLLLTPFQTIRLKSINTSTEAAVNQGAARTLYVYLISD